MIPENSSVTSPRYTMYWLGIHTVFILVIAGILSLLALGIDSLSHSRLEAHLLPAANQTKVAVSTGYSFVLITLTLFSLMLVEIAYRKPINYIQYALIGCALCLFYLLLLSITEPLQFWASYLIVSAMTIGLIGWFVHGIMREPKPVKLTMGTLLAESQRQSQEAATARLDAIDRAGAARQRAANDALLAQLQGLETRLKNLEDTNANRLDGVRATLLQGMANIRADNNKKLDEIRGTVDEKLESTLQRRVSESFRAVSTQLEQVYKGLGEMQNLAADVGSLKQVLSGVKTRGILGEVQLGAILKEILAPGQYAENVATVPGSSNRVEYAVKLPGQSGTVWLPIDAKFPGDTYAHLQDAQASGDPAAVAAARRQLETVVRQEAKDIHDKYIEVPYTTAFGILFLPFEGLYAEVVNCGLPEILQRDYKINIAGPSTMAALLNALQMGFRTLAIQKRSGEVWQILGAVKTEFEKFGSGLQSMQRHLNQTGNDLEELIGTRSRAITRKLESVQQLEPTEAADLLGLTFELIINDTRLL